MHVSLLGKEDRWFLKKKLNCICTWLKPDLTVIYRGVACLKAAASISLLFPACTIHMAHHKLGSLVESRRFWTARSFHRRWPWLRWDGISGFFWASVDMGWRMSQNREGWLNRQVHRDQWAELKLKGHRDDTERIMEQPCNIPLTEKVQKVQDYYILLGQSSCS